MSKIILIGSLLLVFIIGTGLGLFMCSVLSPTTDPEKTTTLSPSMDTSVSDAQAHTKGLLEARILELEKELAEPKKDSDSVTSEGRFAFFKKNPKVLHLEALDQGLEVSSEMADILKLSPEEKQAIEQHLREIQNETQKLEDDKLVLVKQSGNSISYEIPSYPEGKEIKDKLRNLLTADIGSDRTEIFMSNSEVTFSSEFSNFGEGKTELEITRSDQNGTPSYSLKETIHPDANGISGWSSERPIGTTLPARYQKLLKIDPAP